MFSGNSLRQFAANRRLWRRFSIAFGTVLAAFTVFIPMYFFLIPHGSQSAASGGSLLDHSKAVITDTSYQSDDVSIEISQYREYDSDIYVADIRVEDASYFKTTFAEDTFGYNYEDTPRRRPPKRTPF